jgi:hypothetical protein
VGTTVVVLAFVVVCASFGWSEDVAAWGRYVVIGVAVAALALYVAVTWLGSSEASRRGFRFGGEIYFGDDRRCDESAESEPRAWISARVREPFVRLPVLFPIICAAATICSVDRS